MGMRGVLCCIVLLVSAAACGDDKDVVGSGNGQCARRDNIGYVIRYTVRSGDCGAVSEQLHSPGPQPVTVDPPCKGTITYTPDNCEVDYDQTCPNDGVVKGGEVTVRGHSKWNTDASHATALEQWVVRGTQKETICNSTYDVTVDRQ